jgi:uncharacterized protein
MRYKILNSINEIPQAEWDALFGDLPEGYGFYKTLEESGLKEFSLYYAVLYQESRLAAICPLFTADFQLDIAVVGPLARLIRLIRKALPRFMIVKTLFCGSPCGENAEIALKGGPQEKSASLAELVKIMEEFSSQRKISFMVFKDFLQKDVPLLEDLRKYDFLKVESFPSVIAELNFPTFEDYLKSLGQATRKNLRRQIKKAGLRPEIKVEVKDNAGESIDDIYRLYLSTYSAGQTKFEKLTKEFFTNISRNLDKHTKFFLYYINGKLAAFNLCFLYGDLMIDKFIGFDYAVSYEYNLYYFSWCYNIEWCLKNAVRHYQTGQTDYEPKLRLGGKLTGLYAYVKHRNPLFNFIIRSLERLINPGDLPQKKSGTAK